MSDQPHGLSMPWRKERILLVDPKQSLLIAPQRNNFETLQVESPKTNGVTKGR